MKVGDTSDLGKGPGPDALDFEKLLEEADYFFFGPIAKINSIACIDPARRARGVLDCTVAVMDFLHDFVSCGHELRSCSSLTGRPLRMGCPSSSRLLLRFYKRELLPVVIKKLDTSKSPRTC